AQQGFANARFETDMDDGLDVVQEFYSDQSQNQTQQQHLQTHDLSHVQELQQGLQQSVRAVN
ncbi:MAG: hydrolase or metal-binding protein, partial [Acinetobacter sp.]